MTNDVYDVNSQDYWDSRFSENWDLAGGPQQTRFFAELGLRLLPRWVLVDIDSCTSIADIGCAEGEAAALLKERFPKLEVTGIDFSQQAIDVANQRHPSVRFLQGDINALEHRFDVVFCSNVLEHFHDPLAKLEKLVQAANRYVVLLVPGWEYERHTEHHVTFSLSSFPRTVGHMQCIFADAVNCGDINPKQWPGYQLAVIYACPDALATSKGTLADALGDLELRGLSTRDLETLHSLDPAIGRLGELAASRRDPAREGGAIATRIQGLEQRQELINFHTRQEISGKIAALEEGILSRLSESARLQGEQEELRAERDGLRSERDGLRAEQEASRAELGALHAEQEALRAERDELVGQCDELHGTSRKLASELDRTREAHERSMSALAETEQQLSALRASREADVLRAQMEDWRDYAAALNDDRKRLDADLKAVSKLLLETRASTSWVLTAPLRWASEQVLGRGVTPGVPDVEGLREVRFTETHRELAQEHQALAPAIAGDLTWGEFSEWVLAKRADYRGVFIQEMVIDWNVPLYQRPQHMATAFARLGYLVIYVTPQWGGDIVDGFRQISPNIWLTSRWEVNTIPGAVRSVYSTAYAHTPEQLSERPADSVIVYEYIDHIDPQISGEGEVIESLLKLKNWAFDGGADLVVASARVLHAEAESAVGGDKVVMVPNGVDTRHYRNPAQGEVVVDPRLVEFHAKGKPVVGYFGAIAPWLWYEEIEELVATRKDLNFVFIGPDYHGGVQRLPQADNVIYLGAIDYKVLPAHAQLFDVCLIPFRPGEIARTTSPLKLFEYFALEKPVVVTSEMVECVAYPEVFRGATAEGLSQALDAALSVGTTAGSRDRLKELADENDWDRRAQTLALAVDRFQQAGSGR